MYWNMYNYVTGFGKTQNCLCTHKKSILLHNRSFRNIDPFHYYTTHVKCGDYI